MSQVDALATTSVERRSEDHGQGLTASPRVHSNESTLSNSEQRRNVERVQRAVDDINKKLQQENRQVVFEYDKKTNRVWLNVVDKNTGKVLEEMPSKIIRDLVDSLGSVKGLIIDTHL